MSMKEQVLQAIQRLPNDIDLHDVDGRNRVDCSSSGSVGRHRLRPTDLKRGHESRIAQWSAR
jgi:hypothetical protein